MSILKGLFMMQILTVPHQGNALCISQGFVKVALLQNTYRTRRTKHWEQQLVRANNMSMRRLDNFCKHANNG